LAEQQIVQDSSPTGFTNHVLRLLSAPEQLVALGRQNRDRILTDFTIQQMVERYATLYRQLLNER
jgi:glycosyltransferase involved in cell wall biosynthesis